MPNDSLTSGYLMKWGAFTFNLGTAAFQKLLRQDSWRWVTQERFQNDPAEQYIGRGSKIISMEGVIFTAYNPGGSLPGPLRLTDAVGTHQLDLLRYYGDQATPYQLVDGRGNVLGPWALVGVQEDSEYFLVNGAPQKQTFRLEFRYVAPDGGKGYVDYKKATSTATATASLGAAIASRVTSSGLPADTAQSIGAITQSFQAVNNGAITADTASNLANTLGAGFGYSGAGYRGALSVVQGLINTSAGDANSLINNGLPGAAAALGTMGVTDQAAGNNALALAQLAQGGDRGTFISNAATQIAQASGRLGDVGANLNLGAIDQNDRAREVVNTLAASKAADPAGFANAFPADTYPELNVVVDNAPTFAQNVTAVTSATSVQ